MCACVHLAIGNIESSYEAMDIGNIETSYESFY